MLNIAITFDYELFLGGNNAPYYDVLFSPTEKLISLFKETSSRATFFADVCSVFQHEKYGLSSYANDFSNQLLELDKEGQDIQLHIHPHWMLSEYTNEEWKINSDNYCIHTFGLNKKGSAENIINQGIAYLKDLLGEQNPDYKCIAYRAGGFCIQPVKELFKMLKRNGIYIDSSIALHKKCNNSVQYYDYSNVGKRLDWWISPDDDINAVSKAADTNIYEVSIGAYRNKLPHLLYPKSKRKLKQEKLKGTFIGSEGNRLPDHKSRLKRISKYSSTYTTLSLDSTDAFMLIKGIKSLYKDYKASDKDLYTAVIGHPKLVSDFTIDSIRRFIEYIGSHPDKFRLVTMRDIYDEIVCRERILTNDNSKGGYTKGFPGF